MSSLLMLSIPVDEQQCKLDSAKYYLPINFLNSWVVCDNYDCSCFSLLYESSNNIA